MPCQQQGHRVQRARFVGGARGTRDSMGKGTHFSGLGSSGASLGVRFLRLATARTPNIGCATEGGGSTGLAALASVAGEDVAAAALSSGSILCQAASPRTTNPHVTSK